MTQIDWQSCCNTLPFKTVTETIPVFAPSKFDYQTHSDKLLRTWELLGIISPCTSCLICQYLLYICLSIVNLIYPPCVHMLDLRQNTNNLVRGSTDRLVSYRPPATLLNQLIPSLFANSSWFLGLLSSAGNKVTERTPGAPMEDGWK